MEETTKTETNDETGPAIPWSVTSDRYRAVGERILALLANEDDWVAAMATVACELHHSFERFDWTGFYRVVAPQMLAVGPYQGGHGCLRISFERGVCGRAARTMSTQRIADVTAIDDHIACSATTRSELVIPIGDAAGQVIAVLDIDSDQVGAFDAVDQRELEGLCQWLGARYG